MVKKKKQHQLIVDDYYLWIKYKIKIDFFQNLYWIPFRFEFDTIGDVGDRTAVVDTDDVDDDGSIWSEFWLVSFGLLLSVSDSVKSGNDECWSRLICDERLLW